MKTLAVRFEVKDGRVWLYDKDGKYVEGKDAIWNGDFDCHNNQLTSLVGCPSVVGGNFYCSYNQLTSLIGCPSVIDGNFNCYNNRLTSLIGCPSVIGGSFYCENNKLTSLEGCPSVIGGNFYCCDNPLTSQEHQPLENQRIAVQLLAYSMGYLLADGMLQELISHRMMNGYDVFKVKGLASDKESYVIHKDDVFSHGSTVKECFESLAYKISDRGTSEYNNWTVNTVATKSELIVAYRKITGACEFGVKEFVNVTKIKDKMKVKDVIELTKGKFGNDKFSQFFRR